MRPPLAHLSEEVRQALEARGPVVALETSVVSQGLPYPQNLEAARACEEAVRRQGAIPAPIAVLDGEVHVGLSSEQLRRLAEPAVGECPRIWKLGGRDLAVSIAQRATGATTVSATCEIASLVGLRVFATGGIGGVHRGAEQDISEDLQALARCPVAVVCAGAKSILDLPRTLELLETLGVPVLGVGTREFPAFYSRASGLFVDHAVQDAQGAAAVLQARLDGLGRGGLLFALPPPHETALPKDEVERGVLVALDQAEREGIHGKAVTPFLLRRLSELTGGRTLNANLALLVHNARFAAQVAVEDARARNA
jgi:pseudouridine-5'-phosphate glycosidase